MPVGFAVAGAAQIPCERLAALALSHAAVPVAESVPAGPTSSAGPRRPADDTNRSSVPLLPAHCRVAVLLTPSSDSHIEMEIWLPASDWNGKFEAVGNGGWAGSINFGAMAPALREAYATASTDTGHKSAETPGGSFALGHPEKLIDYGYRAIHEMTVKSKAILTAFYGREL